MEERYFDSYIDFGDYLYELAKEKGKDVAAVANYEEAVEIIKWLISHDDVQISDIEVHSSTWAGYDKEFYISITPDLVVYVEPVYIKSSPDSDEYDRLLQSDTDVIFFSGDANYKIVKHCNYEEAYEFIIGENDDYKDECGDCSYDCSNCPKDETDNKNFRVHTITISRKDIPSAFLDLWF